MDRFVLLFSGFGLLLCSGTTVAQSTPSASTPVSMASVATAPTVVQLKRRNAGTYYVPSLIEGFGATNLLVDTGSSHLVISQDMLESLKAQKRAEFVRDLRGVMADGSARVVPVYRISSLRLGQACWIHDIEAAVFPRKSRPILGMSTLAQLAPFTLSTDPATLSLSRCLSAPKAVVAGGGGASGTEIAAAP